MLSEKLTEIYLKAKSELPENILMVEWFTQPSDGNFDSEEEVEIQLNPGSNAQNKKPLIPNSKSKGIQKTKK